MRRGGTPIDTASLFCVIPKPSMKSSIRISPGWIGSISSSSVVVDKFDIFRTPFFPHEAKPPLRINSDAILPAPISSQSLQPVPRRDPEVFDVLRRVDQLKLAQRCSLHRLIDAFDVLLMPDAFSVLATKRSDHKFSI